MSDTLTVCERIRKVDSPRWWIDGIPRELTLEYDHIEWGEWWAEVYKDPAFIQVLHQHGGDDWMRFRREEIPGLIALLILIYTKEYK